MDVKTDKAKSTIAVITGDIVNSKAIKDDKRVLLLDSLKEAFTAINNKLIGEKEPPFEIFRGDSFQAIIQKPEQALVVSMLLRSKIRSIQVDASNKTKSAKNNFDARIAVGIGSVDFISKKITESDGQAFLLSGTTLDSLKDTDTRLKIASPWEEVNAELEVECSFADAVISEWSYQQAEAFYWHLLEHITQAELAKKINKSQPAASKRLKSGKVDSIDLLKKRFENLIRSKL